jgi:hypothetical protein
VRYHRHAACAKCGEYQRGVTLLLQQRGGEGACYQQSRGSQQEQRTGFTGAQRQNRGTRAMMAMTVRDGLKVCHLR